MSVSVSECTCEGVAGRDTERGFCLVVCTYTYVGNKWKNCIYGGFVLLEQTLIIEMCWLWVFVLRFY